MFNEYAWYIIRIHNVVEWRRLKSALVTEVMQLMVENKIHLKLVSNQLLDFRVCQKKIKLLKYTQGNIFFPQVLHVPNKYLASFRVNLSFCHC